MMRAAIYARRSTDEHQAESLEVQLEQARAYCASKGWRVDDAHVFIEDAVSRAEFKKRPALFAMLNGADDKAFDVVVMRDETRFGGDMNRAGILIQDLIDSGCRLFYYYDDHEVTLDDPSAKLMIAVRNYTAEVERLKISQRTREHLMVKARRGLNAGGKAYGYRNVRNDRGEPMLEIVEEEAEVVRRVFRLFADGWGYTKIAKELNAEGVAPASAGKRGTGSWAKSQIRSMLTKERYRGVVEWGRFAKGYKGGTKVRERKPDCEVLRIEVPHLRIIDDELWERVQARMQRSKEIYGKRAPDGPVSKNLLSGLAKCAECGGAMNVETAKFGGETMKLYVCSYNRWRGDSVCSNRLRRPAAAIEAELLERLRGELLREDLVLEVIDELKRQVEANAETAAPDLARMEKRAEELKREIQNGVHAIVKMGHVPELAEAVEARREDLQRVEARIAAMKAAPDTLQLELHRLEEAARAKIAEVVELLQGNTAMARQGLEALLSQPLTFEATELEDGRRRYLVRGAMAPIWSMAPSSTVHVPKEICTFLTNLDWETELERLLGG